MNDSEQIFLEPRNIALMGTHVTNGRGKGVVVLTGARTVMGRISKLNFEYQTESYSHPAGDHPLRSHYRSFDRIPCRRHPFCVVGVALPRPLSLY